MRLKSINCDSFGKENDAHKIFRTQFKLDIIVISISRKIQYFYLPKYLCNSNGEKYFYDIYCWRIIFLDVTLVVDYYTNLFI